MKTELGFNYNIKNTSNEELFHFEPTFLIQENLGKYRDTILNSIHSGEIWGHHT